MDPKMFDQVLILTGPTASGKSAVGLELAERLDAEIVAMDSMTLYRGMDIGTAKPTVADRMRIRHHMIDVLDPWESANVAWWLKQAAAAVQEIRARGKRVLFVGGTPLYLKSLLCGIFAGPPEAPEIRCRLESLGKTELYVRLSAADPQAARRIHPHDLRRLVRALEVIELTGQPISRWQEQFRRVHLPSATPVWLDLPRPELYRRIEKRISNMLDAGWLQEVQRLLELPGSPGKQARQAAGYRELIDHLQGKMPLKTAIARLRTRSRNLAKRQLTWFRNFPGIEPLAIAEVETPEQIALRCLKLPGWQ
jgi:tRNA dimethylallyltransferase